MVSTRIVFVLLAMSLLIGCVTPEGNGSSGNTVPGSVKGKPGGTIVVCGETFTLGDLLQHPVFRQSFQQFITLQQIYVEASKQGITITDEELDEAIEEQKQNIEGAGQSWDTFMEMQGFTIEEFKQMIRTQKLFEKLMEAKLDFSEENLKDYWEKNKDAIVTQHIKTNFLPDTERETLTMEDCTETIKEFMRSNLGFTNQQEVMDTLTLNATVDFSGALPEDTAKQLQETLLGKEQQNIKDRQIEEGVLPQDEGPAEEAVEPGEEAAGETPEMTEETSSEETAEGDEPSAEETTEPPAEETPEAPAEETK